MTEATASRTVEIRNPNGLHMRAARLFTNLAMTFEADVQLVKGNHRVDGKSLLSVMTLAADPGEEIVIEVTGPDSEPALKALAQQLGSAVEPEDPNQENSTNGAGNR